MTEVEDLNVLKSIPIDKLCILLKISYNLLLNVQDLVKDLEVVWIVIKITGIKEREGSVSDVP